MKIERLTPHIGARISGIDLGRVELSQRDELRALLEEHLVLFFVEQKLDLDQFQHFGEVIGELKRGVATPGLRGPDDYVIRIEVPAGIRRGGYADRWHSDECYLEEPNYATILMPECLPSSGGDTCWASMYAAYDNLSEPMKAMLDGLTAVHSIELTIQRMNQFADRYEQAYSSRHDRQQVHPVVITHPETGRKALFISETFTTRIVELTEIESAGLLQALFRHIGSPRFTVRWKWTANDLAFWDNRSVQHFAVPDYEDERVMQRIVLAGERPGEKSVLAPRKALKAA